MIKPELLWHQILKYIRERWRFSAVFGGLIIIEFSIRAILPSIIPDTWYLRLYLPWQSVVQTEKFLNSQLDVELDTVRGWRNRSNYQIDKIRYDQYGSRSHLEIIDGKRKSCRVVLLGDSKINGYTYVDNDETINAFLDDEEIEVLNFGAAFYGLDQSYLTMVDVVNRFQPDVVVIGVGSQEGQLLGCHYIPFMVRKEQWMPMLKPRYDIKNGELVLQKPDFEQLLKDLPNNQDLLNYLRLNDPNYANFEHFQLWQSTPFASIWSLIQSKVEKKISRIKKAPEPTPENIDILDEMVLKSKQLASEHNIKLIYLLNPDVKELYGNRKIAYQTTQSILEKHSIHYIDLLALFKAYSGSEPLLFDGIHTTETAHKLIAAELKPLLMP